MDQMSRKNKQIKSEEHQRHLELANVVKGVHAKLRRQFRKGGDLDQVWRDHCEEQAQLSQYADAMHHLAVDHWAKLPETRIHWCQSTCLNYFFHGGLRKILDKEERRRFYERQKLDTADSGSGECAAEQGNAAADSDEREDDLVSKDTDFVQSSLGISSQQTYDPDCGTAECTHLNQDCSNSDQQEGTYKTDTLGSGSSGIGDLQHHSDCLENQESVTASGTDGPEDGGSFHGISSSESLEADRRAIFEKYKGTKYNTITLPFQGKLRLLDVGSCYNPFLEFSEFLAVGIDISPAVESVHHCDFLHLDTVEPLQLASDTIDTVFNNLKSPVEKLPRDSFHVVVFSLLLEYFPSTYQRWLCCQKAHQLLMINGLLLIITPDSHHQNRNAPMMKSWKMAIESMGFTRCKYEKLEHLHCLAFRKVHVEDTGSHLVSEANPDMLYIPQDFNDLEAGDVFTENCPRSKDENSLLACHFGELPGDAFILDFD